MEVRKSELMIAKTALFIKKCSRKKIVSFLRYFELKGLGKLILGSMKIKAFSTKVQSRFAAVVL